MIKSLTLVLIGFVLGVLGNYTASWTQLCAEKFLDSLPSLGLQPCQDIVSTPRLILAGGFVALFSVLVLCLEKAPLFPWNWWWHRFWFLMDIIRSSPWKTLSARLHLAKGTRQTPGAQVIADGTRQDLVDVLFNSITSTRPIERRVLVSGEPGAGKSTGLEQLQLRLARSALQRLGILSPIPILVKLGSYNRDETLFDFLARSIREWRSNRNARVIAQEMVRLVERGRVVLLLDALDEALGGRREIVLNELESLLRNSSFSKIPVVITTRTREDPGGRLTSLHDFVIEDLDDSAVEIFIQIYKKPEQTRDYVLDQLKKHQLLLNHAMGRNPYWLRLILTTGAFEGNKGQILNRAVDHLLRHEMSKPASMRSTWVRRVEIAPDVQIRETKIALAWLGYRMTLLDLVDITEELATTELHTHLIKQKGIGNLTPQDILGIGRDAQILTYEPGPIEFRHRLLQEYSTAFWLARTQTALDVIDTHSNISGWWETLVILADLISDGKLVHIESFALDYASMIRSVLGNGEDLRRLLLSIALLRDAPSSASGLVSEATDLLLNSIKDGVNTNHKQVLSDLSGSIADRLAETLTRVLSQQPCDSLDILVNLLGLIKSDVAASALLSCFESRFSDLINYRYYAYTKANMVHALGSIGAAALGPLTQILDKYKSYDEERKHRRELMTLVLAALAKLDDAAASKYIVSSLFDPDSTVRGSAVKALGKIQDVTVLKPLILRMTDGNLSVRKLVTATLVDIGTLAVPALVAALKDKANDLNLRYSVVDVLVAIRDLRVVEALLTVLIDKRESTRLRARALQELRRLGGYSVLGTVLDVLKDKNENFRLRELAFSILKTSHETRILEAFLSILRDKNEHPDLRSLIIGVLGETRDTRVVDALLAVINDKRESSHLRGHALQELTSVHGWTSNSKVSNILTAILGDKKEDFDLRQLTIRPLCANLDTRVVDALLAVINDKRESSHLRGHALQELTSVHGWTSNSKALDMCFAILKNKTNDIDLRHIALRSLEQTHDTALVEAFIEVMIDKSDHQTLRKSAIQAVGTSDRMRAVEPLIAVALDKQDKSAIRNLAVKVLGESKVLQAVQPLVSLLLDTENNITLRWSAATNLKDIGDPRAIEALIEALIVLLNERTNKYEFQDRAFRLLLQLSEYDTAGEFLLKCIIDKTKSYTWRSYAMRASDRIRAVEPLIAVALDNEEDYLLRNHAVTALGESKDARAGEFLLKCIIDKTKSYTLRAHCIRTSDRIRAVEPLIAVALDNEEDYLLRNHAVTALGESKDARAVQPLLAIAENKQNKNLVRTSALDALDMIHDARAIIPLLAIARDAQDHMKVHARRILAHFDSSAPK